MMKTIALTASLLVLLATTGCGTSIAVPNLGGIYNRAAQHHDELRNPVIVIPGILGSRLRDADTGRVVWGAFAGDYANPERPDGARLVALPMREGAPLADLRDGGVPDGSLDRLRIEVFGLPIELSAYAKILGTLGVGGYRDEGLGLAGAIDYGDDHYTCFQFDYDWRRDNVENARRLHDFILEKRAYVQKELRRRGAAEEIDVRFDIVAHSMGGLITRYLLRYGDQHLPDAGPLPPVTWAGSRYVDRAILVGTPNAGSVSSLTELVDGASFAPILPTYEPAVLGTMPAVYQLLPRTRHRSVVGAEGGETIDVFDAGTWERLGWGLADPAQDRVLRMLLPDEPDAEARRRIALEHLRKCLRRAQRFHAALDAPVSDASPTELTLVAGDAVETESVLAVDVGRGGIRTLERSPGDGTVTRSSALLDERLDGDWTRTLRTPVNWSGVYFLFTDHLGLTGDPAFTDNVLYVLLEKPRGRTDRRDDDRGGGSMPGKEQDR